MVMIDWIGFGRPGLERMVLFLSHGLKLRRHSEGVFAKMWLTRECPVHMSRGSAFSLFSGVFN